MSEPMSFIRKSGEDSYYAQYLGAYLVSGCSPSLYRAALVTSCYQSRDMYDSVLYRPVPVLTKTPLDRTHYIVDSKKNHPHLTDSVSNKHSVFTARQRGQSKVSRMNMITSSLQSPGTCMPARYLGLLQPVYLYGAWYSH